MVVQVSVLKIERDMSSVLAVVVLREARMLSFQNSAGLGRKRARKGGWGAA